MTRFGQDYSRLYAVCCWEAPKSISVCPQRAILLRSKAVLFHFGWIPEIIDQTCWSLSTGLCKSWIRDLTDTWSIPKMFNCKITDCILHCTLHCICYLTLFQLHLIALLILLLELNLCGIVVKISQLTVLTVDPDVHTTGAFLTGFYCHFDHPQQYKTMLLPVKNGWLILTCKCTNYT